MTTLGRELRAARDAAGKSLRAVATPAGISAAYLQRLESDGVDTPSPRVLQRLSTTLRVPYRRLMTLAGYAPADSQPVRPGILGEKLAATDLTEAEERALAAFLDHLVSQRDA